MDFHNIIYTEDVAENIFRCIEKESEGKYTFRLIHRTGPRDNLLVSAQVDTRLDLGEHACYSKNVTINKIYLDKMGMNYTLRDLIPLYQNLGFDTTYFKRSLIPGSKLIRWSVEDNK